MDPKSGQIHNVAATQEAVDAIRKAAEAPGASQTDKLAAKALMTREEAIAKGLVPVAPEDIECVRKMNRRQRRRWAAMQKRKGRVG